MYVSSPEYGVQIDGWQVRRALGEGGSGEVFLVVRGDQEAALKLLRQAAVPERLARLRSAAAALAQIEHPAVVQIHEIGVWHNQPYLRMERVEGRPLRDLIAYPVQPVAVVAGLIHQLAGVLASLHARGISHGDVTPANVLVDRRGGVRVLDVGVAAVADGADARTPATPEYAPPEWFDGGDAEVALADAYGLGVVLCELLTGERAFPTARDAAAPGRAPLDPGVGAPPALREVVRRLTAPDPRARMRVAEALVTLAAFASLPATITLAATVPDPTDLDASDPNAASDALPRLFGRYVVLRRLGAGGMGAVYLAYDPDLRREVAVKVLHGAVQTPGDRSRLRREAQAMAQLSHPNIVAVHDVGELGDDTFVAMEYIEGRTLADVLAEPPRPGWRAVLELFLAAGRGLAASHDRGLVHRDFKPANVLVSPAGVVKVGDFGLAKLAAQEPAEAAREPAVDPPLHEALTRAGALLGTPAFMAPEQFRREPADARTDQFNFCVALYRGLHDAPPFAGSNLWELQANVCRGARAPRPKDAVPGWLCAAVDRGLALDPAARWPSMHALLQALAADPGRRRRRVLLASGLVAGLAAVAGGMQVRENLAVARCEALGGEASGAWDPPTQARVRAALVASGVGHADDTWDRIKARLDAWVDAWGDARARACKATRDGDPLAAARASCLERERWQLEGLLRTLERPERASANQAVDVVDGLPGRDHCEAVARLRPELRPEDAGDGVIEGVQRRLVEAELLTTTGELAAARALADEALASATALASASLHAEALRVAGDVYRELGDYEHAEEALNSAWFEALRTDHAQVAAEAATSLVFVAGVDRGAPARGREWGKHAAAIVDRLGPESTANLRWVLARHLALLDQDTGAYADGYAGLRRALELAEATYGDEHPRVARSLNDLSIAAYSRGEYDEALKLSDRALAVFAAALGPGHPAHANARLSHGGILLARGDTDGALRDFEAAAATCEAALGPEHPRVAVALNNIAAIHHARGDYARMLPPARRALAIYEGIHGPADARVVQGRSLVAMALLGSGDTTAAIELLRRTLAEGEALGPEHSAIITATGNLGAALAAARQYDEAIALQRDAFTGLERLLGADHPELAAPLTALADVLHRRGELVEARALATRAVDLETRAFGADHPALGRALTVLARILASSGELATAEAHLERARALLERGGPRVGLEQALAALGTLHLGRGEAAAAVASLTRAVTLCEAQPRRVDALASARFALARALDAAAGDPARALALAEQARDGFLAAGAPWDRERAEVVQWLAARATR